ncbi:trifunctional transcriptional regulator/proline dehydrogenase/L-glutamate gamma-semialdehyde dehydrogenase, partial [Dickeya dianthicola]|nr:trifunctional transcriptional regulator/proline dehydrogenase/L-glutamate gamma-semialdehyde dehydrogenase [Dickeya dianthicola]
AARQPLLAGLQALASWARQVQRDVLVSCCQRYGELTQSGTVRVLPGPTGERDTYTLLPREQVLCVADNDDDALVQLAAVLAVGSRALWVEAPERQALYRQLPEAVQTRVAFCRDGVTDDSRFDAVIFHGDADRLRHLSEQLAQRDGAIVGVQGLSRGETDIVLERLLIERSLSINTAAAGGNASLMTIG